MIESFPQLILVLLAGFFLFQAIKRFVFGENFQSVLKFFVTFGVWSVVFFFALFPGMARQISTLVGMGENLNTLIFITFIIVFLFLFRLMRILEKVESELTALTREQALLADQRKD